MIDQIEFHDSRVSAERQDRAIVLRLCPAYVHHWERVEGGWIGEGRSQTAEITLAGGKLEPYPEGASAISDGWLEVDGQRYESMLPAPLTPLGAARGRLELVGAAPIEFSAERIVVRLVGEPELVEALPTEWAPDGEAG